MKKLSVIFLLLFLVISVASADVIKEAVKLVEKGQGKKAIDLLSNSSNSENSKALFFLGMIHDTGKGVESNQALAGKYYLAAAKKGHEIAQLYTGLFFARGIGFAKNGKKAIHWLRKASQQKNTRAMGMLSSLLFQNKDSIVEAYAWSHIAAKYDPIQAGTTARHLISSYCSKAQKQEGKKLIQELESKWVTQ